MTRHNSRVRTTPVNGFTARAVHALDLHAEDAVADGVPGDPDEEHLRCGEDDQVGGGVGLEEEQRDQHRHPPVQQERRDTPTDAGNRTGPFFGAPQSLAGPFLVTQLRRALEPRTKIFSFHMPKPTGATALPSRARYTTSQWTSRWPETLYVMGVI